MSIDGHLADLARLMQDQRWEDAALVAIRLWDSGHELMAQWPAVRDTFLASKIKMIASANSEARRRLYEHAKALEELYLRVQRSSVSLGSVLDLVQQLDHSFEHQETSVVASLVNGRWRQPNASISVAEFESEMEAFGKQIREVSDPSSFIEYLIADARAAFYAGLLATGRISDAKGVPLSDSAFQRAAVLVRLMEAGILHQYRQGVLMRPDAGAGLAEYLHYRAGLAA